MPTDHASFRVVTLIRQTSDVRLIRIDTVRADKVVTASSLHLITPRQDGPGLFADLGRANRAYAAEVRALQSDPVPTPSAARR